MNETATTKDGKVIPKNCLCEYCGYDARDKRVKQRIRENGAWREMEFCCKARGGYYQMGCEG